MTVIYTAQGVHVKIQHSLMQRWSMFTTIIWMCQKDLPTYSNQKNIFYIIFFSLLCVNQWKTIWLWTTRGEAECSQSSTNPSPQLGTAVSSKSLLLCTNVHSRLIQNVINHQIRITAFCWLVSGVNCPVWRCERIRHNLGMKTMDNYANKATEEGFLHHDGQCGLKWSSHTVINTKLIIHVWVHFSF